ncbi:energy transducer TonB [Rhodocyclus purpureus]|uniref:energy transducer TonB n=1 Tax=Rhodocyclus purpureus TaxID=1067 RepID=UPI0019118445|nr:TonB family protein [Rhodocyclus purpureus]MBK5914913.1 hypothetical protein [Rhodocyclus purpureus]
MAAPALRHTAASGEHALLAIAVGVSLLLHLALLSLQFRIPELPRVAGEKALEVVLVERTPPATAPASRGEPSAPSLAQPSPPRQPKVDAKPAAVIAKPAAKPAPVGRSEREDAPLSLPTPRGSDLAQNALAAARGGLVSDAGQGSERRRGIGTRVEEYRFAQYIEDWRLKVERVGTLNYPDAARGKLSGTLVLTVSIRSDGSVEKIEINRSSGHRLLDDAARRIVQMAAPYAPFPPAIRRDTDVLELTRVWSFVNGDSLQTGAFNR